MPKVAEKLELKHYCEKDYFSQDAIFYEDKDEDNFPIGTFVKYITVAIEHENDASSAHEEMNKLQVYNAPLRVLIVYAKPGKETDKLREKFGKIVRDADFVGDSATKRQQLLVVGHPEEVDRWQFFIYRESGFEALEETR